MNRQEPITSHASRRSATITGLDRLNLSSASGNGRSRTFRWLVILVLILCGIVAASLYMNYVPAAGLEHSGAIITVKAGGNFQAALDRAKPGDTIELQAGATFTGAFKLPKKAGDGFVTIRSAGADTLIPAGMRIDPAKHASGLAKLQSNVKGEPTILAAGGAHHFRFVAVEIGPTPEGIGDIVRIGTTEERTVEDLPHHIEFDRVYIHGSPTEGQRRGIAANGRYIKITNSYISDIKRKGEESQAIASWASDGPVEITNNYLEAAAENILFGGAGSYLKLVASDCVVRDNYLNKPVEWMSQTWVVKNLFEIKNGRNIKVTNNLMTNNWAMGQDGTAILFTTRADNGPASIIEDIEFSGNIVRGAGAGINVAGDEGGGGHRLVIRNNIFEDINGPKWRSTGTFMKTTNWHGLVIEGNTIIQTGNIAVAYGKPVTNFVFRNNIVFENDYGIKGDNMGSGQEVIDKLFSNGTASNNVIIGGRQALYREKNYFPVSIGQIGFRNAAEGDYGLRDQSPFAKIAVSQRPGADLNRETVGRSVRP